MTPPAGVTPEGFAAYVEQQIREQDEAMRTRVPTEVHIRKKAGRNLGNQYYSHAHRVQFAGDYHDPMADTLCGAQATIDDMAWADTQWAKNRAYVTCGACCEVRVTAGVRN